MTLIKHTYHKYEFRTQTGTITGDLDRVIPDMVRNGVLNSEILLVLQHILLKDHAVAEFGDVYGEFLYTRQ